jgi:hypothetical protein
MKKSTCCSAPLVETESGYECSSCHSYWAKNPLDTEADHWFSFLKWTSIITAPIIALLIFLRLKEKHSKMESPTLPDEDTRHL